MESEYRIVFPQEGLILFNMINEETVDGYFPQLEMKNFHISFIYALNNPGIAIFEDFGSEFSNDEAFALLENGVISNLASHGPGSAIDLQSGFIHITISNVSFSYNYAASSVADILVHKA